LDVFIAYANGIDAPASMQMKTGTPPYSKYAFIEALWYAYQMVKVDLVGYVGSYVNSRLTKCQCKQERKGKGKHMSKAHSQLLFNII